MPETLPAFHIRGLDGEVLLDESSQYEDLVSEEPATTLGYIDEDDGEVITVGSSTELFDRIDELESLKPVCFDLLASLRYSPGASNSADGMRRWREFIQRKYKGKGKEVQIIDAAPDPEPETHAKNEPVVDVSKPFLTAFEEELQNLLTKNEDPAESGLSSKSATSPQPAPAPNHPSTSELLGQAAHNIRWVGESMARLRNEVPQRAQPAATALHGAVNSAMAALAQQMHNVALDASHKSRLAAQSTRDIDMAEIEAAKEKIRQLAAGIGHIAVQTALGASRAARDIAQEVGRDVSQSVSSVARRVSEDTRIGEVAHEVNKAVDDAMNRFNSEIVDKKVTVETAESAAELEDNDSLHQVMEEIKTKRSSPRPIMRSPHETTAFWEQIDKIANHSLPGAPPILPGAPPILSLAGIEAARRSSRASSEKEVDPNINIESVSTNESSDDMAAMYGFPSSRRLRRPVSWHFKEPEQNARGEPGSEHRNRHPRRSGPHGPHGIHG
ncbi:hypothetical protein EDC01DRAFT_785624, partial [Geopyxis carbonaria]